MTAPSVVTFLTFVKLTGGVYIELGDFAAQAACWYCIEEGELYRLVYHSTKYEPRSMYAILHLVQRWSNNSVFCFDFDDCKQMSTFRAPTGCLLPPQI